MTLFGDFQELNCYQNSVAPRVDFELKYGIIKVVPTVCVAEWWFLTQYQLLGSLTLDVDVDPEIISGEQ
jgi:hypothetical protein